MKKVLMLFLCTILLYGCADDKEEIVQTKPTEKPVVGPLTVQIEGYEASISAKVISDGGSGIRETGFCYNFSEDGVPSLENVKSKKVLATYVPGSELSNVLKLHPEKEYQFVFYALNEKGISYAEVVTAKTPAKDIQLLLPGTYTVSKQISYLNGNIKDYNVQIKNEDGKYFIYGLLCEPLGASASLSKMELIVTQNKESDQWNYNLVIPYQQSGLQVNFQNSKYPTLLVNGAWLFNNEERSFDVQGTLSYEDGVQINITTGYGLVMCDPLTHEIKLDKNYPPVELILGPATYPGDSEEYPRPDCILMRKIAE